MAKVELPASRGSEAFDKAVKKITDSVLAQRNQVKEDRCMSALRGASGRPPAKES